MSPPAAVESLASYADGSWAAYDAGEEAFGRAPVLVVLIIGVFALSTFIFGGHPTLYRVTYYMGIICAIMVAVTYIRMSLPIPFPVYQYVAWVLWATIGCMMAEFREVAMVPLFTAIQILIMVFMFSTMCQDTRSFWIVAWFVLLGALVNVFAGRILEAKGGREEGFFTNPNLTAVGYGVGICVCWASLGASRGTVVRAICVASLVLLHAGLVMTASRGGVLSAVVSELYMIWHWRNRIARRPSALLLLLVVVIGGVTMLPRMLATTTLMSRIEEALPAIKGGAARGDRSTRIRLQLKMVALGVTAEHPFFGIGLSNFWPLGLKTGKWIQTTHDNYVGMLTATGVPGFMIFYSIYVWLWRKLGRVSKSVFVTSSERDLVSLGRMLLVLLVCSDVFSDTNWSNKSIWILMSLCFGFVTGQERRIAARSAAYEASVQAAT